MLSSSYTVGSVGTINKKAPNVYDGICKRTHFTSTWHTVVHTCNVNVLRKYKTFDHWPASIKGMCVSGNEKIHSKLTVLKFTCELFCTIQRVDPHCDVLCWHKLIIQWTNVMKSIWFISKMGQIFTVSFLYVFFWNYLGQ